MSDHQPDPSWWQASDGRWYAPELHPRYQPSLPPTGPAVSGTPGAGPERMAEDNRKGAEGERATAAELATLPPTYRVVHGLKVGKTKADIDHLVVGPSGVWVIDTKSWAGRLTEGKGMLWRGRTPIRREIESVERQAEYARQVLSLDTNPVLCFVGTELPRAAQMVGRTRVLSLPALVHHITSSTAVLNAPQVDAAGRLAQRWLANPPPVEVRAPGRSRDAEQRPPAATAVGARPSRRNRSGARPAAGCLARLLLALVVLVALLAALGASRQFLDRIAKSGHATTTTPFAQPGGSASGSTGSPPTTVPDYFKAEVSCPEANGGYTVKGRVAFLRGFALRVTASLGGEQRFLGEYRSFQPAEPLTGVPPNTTAGFDIQLVDQAGQQGTPYHIDIVTPAAPC
ncbi:MAG: NERD domain-containing protein [Actinobacteria bacterium]|nr:NERD domain-containing protein [Actinomycetota bacterium]